MNHFDDRASYFAFLRDQGRLMDCLDNNQQQDASLRTFGGVQGVRTTMPWDIRAEV